MEIKLLEELVKEFNTFNDLDGIEDLRPYIKAIEKLLNEYKKLEKDLIETLKVLDIGTLKNLNDYMKNEVIEKAHIRKRIEELKKDRDKTYIQFLESNKTDKYLSVKGLMLEGKIEILEQIL